MVKRLIIKFFGWLRIQVVAPGEIIKKNGGKVGECVFIGDDVYIDYDYSFLLEIGDGAVISAKSIIELHDSCLPNVLGYAKTKIGKIIIGKKAYIGVNSVILPGIEIGDSAIVGACSLVNCDIPGGEVWGGVPVNYICTVEELKRKRETCDNMHVGFFDWIGESEKRNVNYPKYKENFIKKVRVYFENEKNKQK